jgi:hypothetical protein
MGLENWLFQSGGKIRQCSQGARTYSSLRREDGDEGCTASFEADPRLEGEVREQIKQRVVCGYNQGRDVVSKLKS